MKKKGLILKTKRLILTPMNNAEIHNLIDQTSDNGLKRAYGEMLAGCEEHPELRLWYAPWKICLRESGDEIGNTCFKGDPQNGAVEIGYGVNPGFEGKGYTTEGAKALIEWAFSQESVYFVEAETAPDNAASKRVLEKLKFQPDGTGEEGPRFLLEKPPSAWMSVYMCLGMSVGMCFGLSFDNIALGMGIGMPIGLCIGLSLDAADIKEREALKAKRSKTENRRPAGKPAE